MRTRSELKVKVARWFSSILLLFSLLANAAYGQVHSQQFASKQITFRCEGMPLEKVLEHITFQSGVRFVYSSSTIDANKPISLKASRDPLDNLLNEIAEQAGVAFKKRGNYIVIKRDLSFASVPPKHDVNHVLNPAPTPVVIVSNDDEYEIPASRLRDYPIYAGITGNEVTDKDFFRSGPGLLGWDTTFAMRNLPILLSNKTAFQYHKRWFASGGLFVNDYSGGVEAQFGLPAAYLVVNGSLLKGGLFRFGYGLGTSIPIKPAVSASLSYTFATVKSREYDVNGFPYKASAQHHQIRIMTNINLSGHFSLRVGPTLNFMNSYFKPDEREFLLAFYRTREIRSEHYMHLPKTGYTQIVIVEPVPLAKEYKSSKTWLGFEAGIAYRINFSMHR